MTIKACRVWTPNEDATLKGVVWKSTRYVVHEAKADKAYSLDTIFVKGIELSPTSEIVLMLHSNDVRVLGYCPYALELDAEEAKE
jgi:hypothetical protein